MGFIKTTGELPPDTDTYIYTTVSTNSNVVLGRQCPLCKQGIIPLTDNSPCCPDCAKALSEMITWWDNTARDWWVSKESK